MHHDAALLRHDPTVVSRNDQRCNATVCRWTIIIHLLLVYYATRKTTSRYVYSGLYRKHKPRETTRRFYIEPTATRVSFCIMSRFICRISCILYIQSTLQFSAHEKLIAQLASRAMHTHTHSRFLNIKLKEMYARGKARFYNS